DGVVSANTAGAPGFRAMAAATGARAAAAASRTGSGATWAYICVERAFLWPRMLPTMGRLMPEDAAAAPTLWRRTCGVTPVRLAALISLGQSFLQACDGPFPRDAGNTYCDPTTRGRPASKFKASSVIGLEERPVLVSLRCRRAAAKSIAVHFKARISSRRAPVSAHS